jgi:hypothetical protein
MSQQEVVTLLSSCGPSAIDAVYVRAETLDGQYFSWPGFWGIEKLSPPTQFRWAEVELDDCEGREFFITLSNGVVSKVRMHSPWRWKLFKRLQ